MNSKTVKILLVEDDALCAIDLKHRLEQIGYGGVETVHHACSARKLLEKKSFDLILMDIQTERNTNGIGLAEMICSRGVPFIFLVAYDDKQIYKRAREIESFGYLLVKPVSQFTLKSMIENALFRTDNPALSTAIFELWQEEELLQKNVFVKSGQKMVRINLDEVEYIQADGNYCLFYSAGRKFVLKSSLKKIKEKLSPRKFVQVHRKYVVQILNVESLDLQEDLIFIGQKTIPIGASFKTRFLEQINKF